MSRESAEAFLEALDRDASLRAKLFASESATAERVLASAQQLAELAMKHGFDVTAQEVRHACARQGRTSSGELGEQELEAVAGGVTVSDIPFTKYIDKPSPTL